MRNEEWLKSLKVGDKVAVESCKLGEKRIAIRTVTKITPTRQIEVSGYSTKFKHGEIYGEWGHSVYIREITDEIQDFVLRTKLISEISSFKLDALKTSQLADIKKIIEG